MAAAAVLCAAPVEFRASIEYCRVIDVSGKAEILESGGQRWVPLSVSKFLKGGDKIRTAEKSYAEISTSPDFSGLLKLGGDSELEIIGDDLARFFLRGGALFVLREEDSNVPGKHTREEALFQIFTKDMSISFLQGGCLIGAFEKGSWVRVFSEHAKVGPFRPGKEKEDFKIVREGFKYFMTDSKKAGVSGPIRMHYPDYIEWQYWMKKCYDRKDARAQGALVTR